MKKLFLLFVVSMLAMTGAKAEEPSTLVATLNHEGKMWAFYGKKALIDAYNFAREGDVITLSAGTFTAVNMTKNLTIRGVGMFSDIPTSNSYTALEGYPTITIQNNDSPISFEGLCFLGGVTVENNSSAKRITFTKVRFEGNASYSKTSVVVNPANVYAVFNDCIIYRALQVKGGLLQNCLVEWLRNDKGNDPLSVNNCVIYDFKKYYNRNGYYYGSYINDANLTNTLLIGDGTLVPDWSTYDAYNCVGFSTAADNGTFFAGANESNRMVEDREHFFKDSSALTKNTDQYGDLTGYTLAWLGWYDLNANGHGLYELSDEAAKIYKGNDGTVVGVWGGAYPFNITPSNPRLKKCEIVPKVGTDGKLKVTIEVAQ
ncbi:MAG: hypothetical protein IJ887_11250 [Prevotella sp.]|nr:hypothetical protein [Prevotella sp.]MBR6188696.1 hypothetical protein [Prevotella sp.]